MLTTHCLFVPSMHSVDVPKSRQGTLSRHDYIRPLTLPNPVHPGRTGERYVVQVCRRVLQSPPPRPAPKGGRAMRPSCQSVFLLDTLHVPWCKHTDYTYTMYTESTYIRYHTYFLAERNLPCKHVGLISRKILEADRERQEQEPLTLQAGVTGGSQGRMWSPLSDEDACECRAPVNRKWGCLRQ